MLKKIINIEIGKLNNRLKDKNYKITFDKSVFETLMDSMKKKLEEDMRSIAAGFLLFGDVMKSKVGDLSEGQKGLVAFAKLRMEEPGLLILDEPTNHINFRHIPVIAEALNQYKGAIQSRIYYRVTVPAVP